MSVIFEAVLLVGDLTVVRAAFNSLRVPLALELHQADQQGFVILTKFEEPGRVFQWEQVDRLAASLSVSFGTTLSVHYDDRRDIRVACLFQDGAVVRGSDHADEVWAPLDDDGNPRDDGPRYPGDQLPRDEECDCIRQAIDVGIEATGFRGSMTLSDLRNLACSDGGWLAQRVGEHRWFAPEVHHDCFIVAADSRAGRCGEVEQVICDENSRASYSRSWRCDRSVYGSRSRG